MIEVSVTVKLNKNLLKELKTTENAILEQVARATLDNSINVMPMNTGVMRQKSVAYGVRKIADGHYRISSDTDYAMYPWLMNDTTTNWTTPGTGNKWFEKTYQRDGNAILKQVIERNRV